MTEHKLADSITTNSIDRLELSRLLSASLSFLIGRYFVSVGMEYLFRTEQILFQTYKVHSFQH